MSGGFDGKSFGKRPTVCVTGARAGVDSVWGPEKPEARKMLENAVESPASSARCVRRTHRTPTNLFDNELQIPMDKILPTTAVSLREI